jgi:DNA-binding MarR family transcriptional regulator
MPVDVSTFMSLDAVLHVPGRLHIASALMAVESLSFRELKDITKMTDGNLSVHMRTLEEADYVAVTKSFVDRRPRTQYAMTKKGRQAFAAYIDGLEQIVQSAKTRS